MRNHACVVSGPPRQHHAAFVASMACHTLAILALVLTRLPAESVSPATAESILPSTLIWIPQAGSVGGGGGGGMPSAQAPRRLERVGTQRASVPARPPAIEPRPLVSETPPDRPLDIAVMPLASGAELVSDVLESPIGTDAHGPGTLGGSGGGDGDGLGPGLRDGLNAGRNGNTGGDVRSPGNGVTSPVLVHQVRPAFTIDAMRARISGTAILECVVNIDGTVDRIRIVRSLDDRYGLDQQAIEALRAWRFKPGMIAGQPVPVLVRVELAFSLR